MTSEFPAALPKGRGVCPVSFHPERSQSSALRDAELGSATGQSRAGGGAGPRHDRKCSLPGRSSVPAEERDEGKQNRRGDAHLSPRWRGKKVLCPSKWERKCHFRQFWESLLGISSRGRSGIGRKHNKARYLLGKSREAQTGCPPSSGVSM